MWHSSQPEFLAKEVKELKDESYKFDYEKDRLDDFYFQHASIKNYKELSFVVKVVLIVSHGQAAVERGFSLNNSLVKINMSQETIISHRIIKDNLLANDLKAHTIEVTSALIKAF